MRVKRNIDIAAILRVIRLEDIVDLDETLGLIAPEPMEDPNEIADTEIFSSLKPGNERVCVVLRSDGLTYKTIGEIMGLSEGQVKNLMGSIRKRITAQVDKNHLQLK